METTKKGFTLVEFIVAVTIFIIVMTVAVGSIISLSRYKIMLLTMKETQEKGRIALEMISRYAKEAKTVEVQNSINPTDPVENQKFKTVYLTYNSDVSISEKKIEINGSDLSICDYDSAAAVCKTGTIVYLAGGGRKVVLDGSTNYFIKRGNTTSELEMNLNFSNPSTVFVFDDSLALNTIVLLEGMKE